MTGTLDGANTGAWLALILSRAPELKREESAAQSPAALPMGSEAFAGFYERSARSLWAYLARASGDAALIHAQPERSDDERRVRSPVPSASSRNFHGTK